MRALGVDPFKATQFEVTAHAVELHERYASLSAEAEPPDEEFALAGRLMAMRPMGKSAIWADIWDRSGRMQIYVRGDAVGPEQLAIFDQLDIGDGIGVRGSIFRSKKGDLTLRVRSFEVLTKALAPLPDKWHGLVDIEKRYRQRYVDLIMNEDVRNTFITRSKIVAAMRRFCDERGFLECETPVLLNLAGGAMARPFRTHHHALDIGLDLRIATELNLKRLIVGGLERVYEIGRTFRNEGIDRTHNPEFTMLELYAAYWSVREMMDFNEELISYLVRTVLGREQFSFGDLQLDFRRPFKRMPYFAALEQHGGLKRGDLLDPERVFEIQASLGLARSQTHGQALDKIFEKVAEPHLLDPTFVYDYPVVISPLAKRKPDDPELVDRYELFGAHFELSNAFTELNDPDDQRARFEAQIGERRKGDEEVPHPDWDLVNALEYGMPPTAGIGIGVDRLVMLLTGHPSIHEVILFPLQRPLA